MTCKDCLHSEDCYVVEATVSHGLEEDAEILCTSFKNKADYVEVVRCKDCENYTDFDATKCKRFAFHFCNKFMNITKETDYCSYGRRKEGVDND